MQFMETYPGERQPFIVHVPRTVKLSRKQFWEFCQANRDWRCERTSEGDIVIMPPTGGESGAQNLELERQVGNWARVDGSGVAFDSSTGFDLPNGATRSADVAWVRRAQLAGLTRHQKRGFLPLCPDFVIELKSPTDALAPLQDKLREYIANGARLGWLIDPDARAVYVHRPDSPVEHLDNPATLSGDPVLPGFVFDCSALWEAGL